MRLEAWHGTHPVNPQPQSGSLLDVLAQQESCAVVVSFRLEHCGAGWDRISRRHGPAIQRVAGTRRLCLDPLGPGGLTWGVMSAASGLDSQIAIKSPTVWLIGTVVFTYNNRSKNLWVTIR